MCYNMPNMPPLHHLHKLLPHLETTAESLNHSDQSCQLLISHLLKSTQQTSFEEHLRIYKWSDWNDSLQSFDNKYYSIDNICRWYTLVCPNLYSSWGTSIDPSSFSEAFLLSMNWPSGMTLAFSTLYLSEWVVVSFITQMHSLRYISSCCLLNERIPLLEVCIEDSAGEALSADSDALQYTVTPQLVDNQEVLHQTCEKLPLWLFKKRLHKTHKNQIENWKG